MCCLFSLIFLFLFLFCCIISEFPVQSDVKSSITGKKE